MNTPNLHDIPTDRETLAAVNVIRAACEARGIGVYGKTGRAFRAVLDELRETILAEVPPHER